MTKTKKQTFRLGESVRVELIAEIVQISRTPSGNILYNLDERADQTGAKLLFVKDSFMTPLENDMTPLEDDDGKK